MDGGGVVAPEALGPGSRAAAPPLLTTRLAIPPPAPALVDRPLLTGRLRPSSTGRLALFGQLGKRLSVARSFEAFAHLAARDDSDRAPRLYRRPKAGSSRLNRLVTQVGRLDGRTNCAERSI
jgi:hypothetical protein